MSDAYDPSEPEGGRKSSQYVTRKDVRIVGIALILLAIAAVPAFKMLMKRVNESVCSRNLRKIGQSMLAYAADNDEHLPFAYESAGYESKEIAVHNGYAYTWQWALEPYTNNWDVFKCPAADESEHSGSADPSTGQVRFSDYGMLNAYSGRDVATIPYPDQKILIAETSKSGAEGTFDPLQLRTNAGVLKDDGFVIGFDNDPDVPNANTKYATRLAFPGSAKGGFTHDTDGRHPAGIHFITAGGVLISGDATTADVIQLGGNYGRWDVPRPSSQPSRSTIGLSAPLSQPPPKR